MKAILLSGGMDSISLAWWKRPKIALTIDYGQKAAKAEIAASMAVCDAMFMRHEVVRVDCARLGSGDMAGNPPLELAPVPEWWPYRNQLLITLAGMAALRLGVDELMLGAVASDDVHADGRAEFFAAMSHVMEMQEGGLTVSAPALHLTSAELVRASGVTREILAWAHSCHTGEVACGWCRGCVKHYLTLEMLGYEPY